MADNIFYVYQYINEDGQPYYIGKGSGKRIDRPHTSTLLPPKERRVIIKDGHLAHHRGWTLTQV